MTLAYSLVPERDAHPRRWALFLHGILGRGSNWQSFARRMVELCAPSAPAAGTPWGAILADLRMHGESQGLPGPHTLAAALADVRELITAFPEPVEAVIGHSFGGKLAVGLLRDAPPSLRQVWVLDAAPSAKGPRAEADLIRRVLDALGRLPPRVQSRAEFVAGLHAAGVEDSIAKWLAKNLIRDAQGLHFGLDLDAIEALLTDHDHTDVWPLVEAPPPGVRLGYVLGGRSQSLPLSDRERLADLDRRHAIELHVLPQAGHWLHADDPAGLLEILQRRLTPPS
jgi:pimeloyl-ACP methyl ester carboxylesterase